MAGGTDDDGLDSFEAELEGLLLQDPELASASLEVRLREELPPEVELRLELSETLGTGGAGAVVRATQRDTGEDRALKLLRVEGASAAQRARIKREYRAGRRLSHPHVVRSDAFFEGDRVWAFTMELLDGSLRRRIARGPLPWETAVHIAQEVLAALDYVHSEHVVHRDLKPENILLGPDRDGAPGLAKLADFGIARFGELGDNSSAYGMAGTPAYMPPEAFDERRFDPRGDLYALGLVLLEMLSGAHPLDTPSADDWPRRHRELAPTRPADIPDALWDVVLSLLQTRPEARPKTAREAFEALDTLTAPRGALPPLRGGAYVASTALIGRDEEMKTVRAWRRQRFESTGAPVLWLSGPAGVGKSRLLQRLATDDEDIKVLFGRGQRHVRRPFSSLTAALGLLGRQPAPHSPTFPAASTVPLTADARVSHLTDEPRIAGHPMDLAHRAFLRSVVDELLLQTKERPLLLIVEDAQWSDEASIELLDDFAHALAAQRRPAAVLVTSRPLTVGTQASQVRERLLAEGLAQELELGPLPAAATAELVGALLMDDAAGARLAARLNEAGTTTPLMVVQTLHVLLGRGALADPAELAIAQLPHTVQKAVGERAANLSGLAKALLAMAAVLGSEFTVSELTACLGSESLELLDYLDEAEQRGFVSQSASVSETYRFVHEELRAALISGLADELGDLHRRAADGLIAVHSDRDSIAARAAYHLTACEDWPAAWEWGRRAGEVALGQYGFQASARLFDRAFAAAKAAGLDPDVEAWQHWGDALMFNDRNEDAASAYEGALERVEADDDREVVILGRLAELEYRSSRLTHALEPLEALLPRLGASVAQTDDEVSASVDLLELELRDPALIQPITAHDRPRHEVLCHTYRNLAEVAYYFRAARQDYYAAEAARMALRLHNSSAAAQAFGLYAFLAAQDGRFDVVDEIAARAVRASDECDDIVAKMFARSMVASAWVMSGEPLKGIAESTEAWVLAQQVAEPLRLMTVASVQSLSLAVAGRADEAATVAETMQELGVRYGYTRVSEMAYLCGAAAGLYALDFDKVRDLAAVADELEATGSRMIALQLRSYRTVAHAFSAPGDENTRAALDIADDWSEQGFGSMLCNIDGNAVLVGALSARPDMPPEDVERLERCIERGWEPSHRNRAKTGLFLAAAGLFRRARGADEQGWLQAGVDWMAEHDLAGDLALFEAARKRVLSGANR